MPPAPVSVVVDCVRYGSFQGPARCLGCTAELGLNRAGGQHRLVSGALNWRTPGQLLRSSARSARIRQGDSLRHGLLQRPFDLAKV